MNPYEILGVDVTADKDAIKKAFRRKGMKLHPDQYRLITLLTSIFQEVCNDLFVTELYDREDLVKRMREKICQMELAERELIQRIGKIVEYLGQIAFRLTADEGQENWFLTQINSELLKLRSAIKASEAKFELWEEAKKVLSRFKYKVGCISF